MIIFVILFSAFLYFSGSFNIMREGLTLKATNMKCNKCLESGSGYSCSDSCKTFISDNNIKSTNYKAYLAGSDTFFINVTPKPITFNGNCTGCQLVPNPSNLPCDSGGGGQSAKCGGGGTHRANAKDYNCVYYPDFKHTKCTPK